MATAVKKLVLAILLGCSALAYAQGDPQPQRREREVLRERPSGFWTSNRPATHGAYRWRLLGLGVLIAGITGYVMVRVVRGTRPPRVGELRAERGDHRP